MCSSGWDVGRATLPYLGPGNRNDRFADIRKFMLGPFDECTVSESKFLLSRIPYDALNLHLSRKNTHSMMFTQPQLGANGASYTLYE